MNFQTPAQVAAPPTPSNGTNAPPMLPAEFDIQIAHALLDVHPVALGLIHPDHDKRADADAVLMYTLAGNDGIPLQARRAAREVRVQVAITSAIPRSLLQAYPDLGEWKGSPYDRYMAARRALGHAGHAGQGSASHAALPPYEKAV